MNRLALSIAMALALGGCQKDEDLPDDPPYAVPGHEVTQPPAGQAPAQAMPSAPPSFDPPLAVPGQPSPLPMPQPPMPQPGQIPPGAAPTTPITLAAGFTPDPHVERGVTAGQVPASTVSQRPDCTGYLPGQPSDVLTLTTPFPKLRVLVNSETDTVLVIRQPDGTFLCNDDAEPGVIMNPLIDAQFAPGAYTVWVGTYDQGTTAPYVIGFTTNESVTADQLAP